MPKNYQSFIHAQFVGQSFPKEQLYVDISEFTQGRNHIAVPCVENVSIKFLPGKGICSLMWLKHKLVLRSLKFIYYLNQDGILWTKLWFNTASILSHEATENSRRMSEISLHLFLNILYIIFKQVCFLI